MTCLLILVQPACLRSQRWFPRGAADDPLARLFSAPRGLCRAPRGPACSSVFGPVSGFRTLANVLQGRSSDRNRAREWLSHRTNTSKTVKSGTSLTIYKDSVVLEGQISNTTIHQRATQGESSAALEGHELGDELNSHGDVSLINPHSR